MMPAGPGKVKPRMDFMLVSVGMIALIVLVLVLLGNAYPGSGADLVDWKPTRSFEDEAQLEAEDVQQMMEAQNEMRRRRGETEMTDEDLRRWVDEDEAVRARARGPEREDLDDLEDEPGP
jgi:hypothetical protein